MAFSVICPHHVVDDGLEPLRHTIRERTLVMVILVVAESDENRFSVVRRYRLLCGTECAFEKHSCGGWRLPWRGVDSDDQHRMFQSCLC